MQKRACVLKYVTLVLLTFLVTRADFVTASPGREYREASGRTSLFHFGQSQAFADFDGDNRLDLAMLSGVGRNKSLEIYLSHTKAHTLVNFHTQTSEPGSLFTRDIDNDGDNDLIWTDLLHPDDVVVWLDDGTGRFECVCPDEYAADFVLTDRPSCGDSEGPHQDFALSPQRDPSPALSPARKTDHFDRAESFAEKRPRPSIVSFPFQFPFDRGPPSTV